MAKTKLNMKHRSRLRALAANLVEQTTDKSARDEAHARAAKHISEQVAAMYPAGDMAVLLKYGLARTDRCIYVTRGGADFDLFTFEVDDPLIPVRPGGRYNCNQRTPIMLNDAAIASLDDFDREKKAIEEGVLNRRRAFYVLIDNAKTFEEVVDVWPAAEQLRSSICGAGTAISLMSDDVIAQIRADAAATVQAE